VNAAAPPRARLLTAVLAGCTVALHVVGLDRSGWGNSFYAAAAQGHLMRARRWLQTAVGPR